MGHRFINVEPWKCTDDEYFHGDHYGSSSIAKALGFDGPGEKTSELGNAAHVAVLQPGIFEQRVITPPAEVLPGSGDGQRARRKVFDYENRDKIILSAALYDKALSMRDAIRSHGLVGPHLDRKEINFEQSFRAIDSETGLQVRVRCDALSPGNIDDMKMSKSPGYAAFRRAIRSYAYHIQAALYVDVLSAFLGRVPRFHWIVVGNAPPYRVGIYEAHSEWIEWGRKYYSAGLSILAASRVRGRSPIPWWSSRRLVVDGPTEHEMAEMDVDVSLHERHAAAMSGGVQ